ncbi:sulfatase-like hydrolase/transferase [Aquiflexum sp.]|uniref:sulfatase-like hydrolase/transferase n=1 Tax=Aquiflexum sp. TaxID=1872584 RepID=UPI003593B670
MEEDKSVNRRKFFFNSAAFAGALLTGITLFMLIAPVKAQNKNVVLIISDDQGFTELGAYMDFAHANTLNTPNADYYKSIDRISDLEAPIDVCFEAARKCMPNVDKLYQMGARFTSFYAAPTCAPSRAALLTALYPQRYGIYSNDDMEKSEGLALDALSTVKYLQDAGYMTGMVGKWHLGDTEGRHPNDVGFDYFFGFNNSWAEKYESEILFRNRQNIPAKGWLADQTSEEAIEFLKRADASGQPFFLKVSYNEPHGPVPPPPQKYMDSINSGSENLDVHFGTLYGMDYGIGEILKQLEKMGASENTLIMFGSDNGVGRLRFLRGFVKNDPSWTKFSDYMVPVPGNGPLRGCKWTVFEGAVRVPFIAYLPGMKGGQTFSSLVSIMDVMPTVMKYAGIKPENKLDGKSFLSILKNNEDNFERNSLIWACDVMEPFDLPDKNDEAFITNRVTENLKILNKKSDFIRSEGNPPGWFIIKDNWKLMGIDTLRPVLFNLSQDISESNDLSFRYPDKVKMMFSEFRNWLDEMNKPVVYSEEQYEKLFKIEIQ